MAGPLVADRVKETSTTTGTGTLDLAGAASGFRTFVAGIGTGNTCFYAIVHQSVAEWEVGIGTVTDAATDTLSRTTVIASSNSNALVSFSAGTKDVFVTYPGARWGPMFPFTAPVNGDFAWINQGSATIAATAGGLLTADALLLSAPSNGAAINWRIRKKTAPATPYTITAWFLYNENWTGTANNSVSGPALIFRQSSDGALHTFQVWGDYANTTNGFITLASTKWTSPSAFSAYYEQTTIPVASPLWCLRIADNGTNRICSISVDGVNFIAMHTVGRTDFLTADEVGFGIEPHSEQVDMTLLSWAQG